MRKVNYGSAKPPHILICCTNNCRGWIVTLSIKKIYVLWIEFVSHVIFIMPYFPSWNLEISNPHRYSTQFARGSPMNFCENGDTCLCVFFLLFFFSVRFLLTLFFWNSMSPVNIQYVTRWNLLDRHVTCWTGYRIIRDLLDWV